MIYEVLYWGADWCSACHTKRPLVEQTCQELGVPFTYCDVDLEDHKKTAIELGFKSIPALAVKAEGTVIYRAIGGLINRPALEFHLGVAQAAERLTNFKSRFATLSDAERAAFVEAAKQTPEVSGG